MNKQQNSNPILDPEKIEQQLRTQEAPCVSVLVNLFTSGNMLKQNITNLARRIESALTSIEIWPGHEEKKATLKAALESLVGSFRNTGTPMGVGLFVSPNVQLLVEFPFQVIECSIVGKSFEVRDILYLQQYLEPYYALSINKDSMHLFKGRGPSLVEITGEVFPKNDTAVYEYEHASIRSSHGYSLKSFEKDKGSIANIRQESFVKSTARHLGNFINDPHAQLIVTGPPRLVNEVEMAYQYHENLARVDGVFNEKTFNKFTGAVWEKVVETKKDLIARTIKGIEDLPLNSKVKGLRDVWEAAMEGRGLLLLVERDLQRIAYRLPGTNFIRLHPPKEKYEVIADGVDDVIEMVTNKNGRVIFTEPGQLSQFEGIVLKLRY